MLNIFYKNLVFFALCAFWRRLISLNTSKYYCLNGLFCNHSIFVWIIMRNHEIFIFFRIFFRTLLPILFWKKVSIPFSTVIKLDFPLDKTWINSSSNFYGSILLLLFCGYTEAFNQSDWARQILNLYTLKRMWRAWYRGGKYTFLPLKNCFFISIISEIN